MFRIFLSLFIIYFVVGMVVMMLKEGIFITSMLGFCVVGLTIKGLSALERAIVESEDPLVHQTVRVIGALAAIAMVRSALRGDRKKDL